MVHPESPKWRLARQLRQACVAAVLAAGLAGAAEAAPARDLNRNGRIDPYEDSRLAPEARTEDLLRRMTLEEKVGTMLHGSLWDAPAPAKGYDLAAAGRLIAAHKITSVISRLTIPPALLAAQNNAIQRLAARTRLGIPVTISTDPRNHFQAVFGASTTGGGFSLWPETLGFAAIGDPALVRRFGEVARREYRAVGIHMALSPQADLATEPRWPRVTATFGADPALVSALAGAYVEGFQGSRVGLVPGGVATVAKHWVGYGAQPDGFDAHNQYGRRARLDRDSFAQHVAAFDGALAARTSGIMPTYPVIEGVALHGRPLPAVGAGFNRELLTTLLRGDRRYDGMILSDWAITSDCPAACTAPTADQPQTRAAIGMPWGVEALSRVDRFVLGVEAGLDQFGGVEDPAPLLAAVRAGRIPQRRIDQSVRRILLVKYRLGLFDNPYVDAAAAGRIVGNPAIQAEADAAQRRAQVVLDNRGGLLPLRRSAKVWLHKLDPAAARAAGLIVVDDPAAADVALIRTGTPSEKLHPHHFFGARQNEGRLDFRDGDPDYALLKRLAPTLPTAFVIDMDRPAILTNVRDKAKAILVTFGASDAAVFDVLTGRARAEGRLPFELPSSMAEVAAQDPARPDDSARPLYPRGAGIR